jgi:plasmid stabilization system protein ParE
MLVSLSREAQADANEAIDWYLGEGAFLAADEFTNELDQALAMLTTFQSLGGKSAHNTRIVPLHNFPYSLIYRLQPGAIRVIAIAHHSRRPGYWAGRR